MDVIQASAAKVLILKLGGGGGRQAGRQRDEAREARGARQRPKRATGSNIPQTQHLLTHFLSEPMSSTLLY